MDFFSLDVEKLLMNPIRIYEKFDIKFKRTKQLIDPASFKLTIAASDTNEKVMDSRIRLYVSYLLRNNNSFTIHDLSTTNEQILLVQYPSEISKTIE